MKTFLSHVVRLASLAGVAPLFTSGQATNYATEKGSRAQEDIRRLNTEEVEAFLHKDPGSMARLWSDDFVVTNPLTSS